MTLPASKYRLLRGLADSLPMALLRSREALVQRFRAVLAPHDLTEQQWRILRALDDQSPLEMSVLAERCQLLLPSLTGILKRLEGRNLVRRQPSPHDGRTTLLRLTPQSQTLIEQIKPEVVAVYTEIEALLGQEKLELLYDLLRQLEGGLETY